MYMCVYVSLVLFIFLNFKLKKRTVAIGEHTTGGRVSPEDGSTSTRQHELQLNKLIKEDVSSPVVLCGGKVTSVASC